MGTKRYTLHLGYMELKALNHALENSMDYEDVVESLFPQKNERAAAERANQKVKNLLLVAKAMQED